LTVNALSPALLRWPLLLLLASFLSSTPAFAQSGDGGTDAGEELPDASVGEGGSERDNPEGEDNTGRVQTDCRVTDRCAAGFQCVKGECVYIGIRDAEGPSCALGSLFSSLVLGAWLVARRLG